jgi:C4-dicarboxylate-binding protein DctP
MKSRVQISVGVLFCLFFFTSVSLSYSAPLLIRFSHVVAENTPKGIGAQMFKDLVESRLKGRVAVEIYPASEKFTDEQAILALLFGDIELAAPSFPKFHKFSKALEVFDLPFLFESQEEINSFQQSETGQTLLSSMENVGIKGLRYWDNGMRVISADKPIEEPADLKGLLMRIESSCVFREQYALLGAIPIQMPFDRLKDSLRDGVVAGYENAWSNIAAGNLQLLRPYFIETDHSYLGYMVVSSTSFWNSLPDDIRIELEAILDEVTSEVNDLAQKSAKADREKLMRNESVTIVTPTDEERILWKKAMLPVWKKFEDEIGADVIDAARISKDQPAR